MFSLTPVAGAARARLRRLPAVLALGAGLLIASLSASAPSAEAHALCAGGSHRDWHTIKFHYDTHSYWYRNYVGIRYQSDGLPYHMYEYVWWNSPHAYSYSKSCRGSLAI